MTATSPPPLKGFARGGQRDLPGRGSEVHCADGGTARRLDRTNTGAITCSGGNHGSDKTASSTWARCTPSRGRVGGRCCDRPRWRPTWSARLMPGRRQDGQYVIMPDYRRSATCSTEPPSGRSGKRGSNGYQHNDTTSGRRRRRALASVALPRLAGHARDTAHVDPNRRLWHRFSEKSRSRIFLMRFQHRRARHFTQPGPEPGVISTSARLE